jgi:hypothetical protein
MQRQLSACEQVVVPRNAYLSSRGPIETPHNGLLEDSGNAWRCDVGFRRIDQRCVIER